MSEEYPNSPLSRRFNVSTGRRPKRFEVRRMRHVHKRIAEKLVQGKKIVTIAHELGVTPAMIQYTKNSPIVKQYIDILDGAVSMSAIQVHEALQKLAPHSLGVQATLMLDPGTDDKLRSKIAQDLLDRAGHSPVKKVLNATGQMTADDLQDIKRRALLLGRESGVISSDTAPETGGEEDG